MTPRATPESTIEPITRLERDRRMVYVRLADEPEFPTGTALAEDSYPPEVIAEARKISKEAVDLVVMTAISTFLEDGLFSPKVNERVRTIHE